MRGLAGPKVQDITGKRFGKLLVIKLSGSRDGRRQWECLCDCGHKCEVFRRNIVSGVTKSCGCLKFSTGAYRTSDSKGIPTPEYRAWLSMRKRCSAKNTRSPHRYTGRGIKVCSRWANSFQNFFDDMGKRPSSKHSLDRINNNKNYEPSNCRWATQMQQCNNKENNIVLLHKGKTRSLIEHCAELGMKPITVRNRLARGWSVQEALETPVNDWFVSYNGKRGSIRSHCKELGLNYDVVVRRVKKGWTIENAFQTHVGTREVRL